MVLIYWGLTDDLIYKYYIEYLQENTLSTKQSEELKAETKPVKAKILAQKAKETPYKIQDILEIKSSFSKILRITCYFLKFLSKTINGITDGNKRKHLEDKYFSKNFLIQPKEQFQELSIPVSWDVQQIFTSEKHKQKYSMKKLIHWKLRRT